MQSRILTFLFFFIFIIASYGQDSLALFKRKNTGLVELNPLVGVIIGPDGEYAVALGINTRFGYFLQSKTAIMLDFTTTTNSSNFISVLKSSTNFGLAIRQYFGTSKRSGFYTQLGYNMADSRISKINGQAERYFPSPLIIGNLGMSFRGSPNWYANYSVGYNYSINGVSYLSNNIGITYLFNSKYKDYPKIQKDTVVRKVKKDSIICKGLFQVANDFFVFPFSKDNFGERYILYEWNSRIGYFVGDYLSLGISGGLYYGQPSFSESKLFYTIGPYANFRVLQGSKSPLYLEAGYSYSNLSIPEKGLPQSSITHYLNVGGGLNIKLKENVYFDLGLVLMNYVGGEVKCEGCGGASIIRVGIEAFIR
jgi:hypothetical protein